MHRLTKTISISALFAMILASSSSGAQWQMTPQLQAPAAPPHPKLTYAPVVKKSAPAVVSIMTLIEINRPNPLFGNDPFFKFFFGQNESPTLHGMANSLGSGVIVDPSGLVATCLHVVKDAKSIKVRLNDNREYEGKVITKDPQNDLAIIRLDNVPKNTPLPSINLEDAETEIGDVILAIGNPFGVGQTVSNGIISAIARNVGGRLLLQTDASINPGNSGGALVNSNGNLVGIPNQILSKSGASHGIGFAIPAVLVKRAIDSALHGSTLTHPWIGLHYQPLTPELATTLGLPTPQGVLISSIHPLSPTYSADPKLGLKQGDVILAINGQPTPTPEELMFRLQSTPVNKDVRLNIFRNKQNLVINVDLIEPPSFPVPDSRRLPEDTFLGDIEVSNLSPAMGAKFQLHEPIPDKGVIISDLGTNQMALRLGLRQGDIVETLNGNKVDSVEDLFKHVPTLKARGTISIRRGNERLTINHS